MTNAKCSSPTEAFLTSEALAKEVSEVGKPKRIPTVSLVYRYKNVIIRQRGLK